MTQLYIIPNPNGSPAFCEGGVPPDGAEVLDAVDFHARMAAHLSEAPPATPADLLAYASATQDRVMAQVWTFNVAPSGQAAHVVTTRLDDRGQFAMLKVQGWLTLNAARAEAAMPYSNVDYSATTLTPAEADSLVEQSAALDTEGYATLNAVAAAIVASPPTITSAAEIDAAFAALAPAA